MIHIFPDDKGNLYGVGTEVGDFSQVTKTLYLAEGYDFQTLVNNLITQLLLLNGHLSVKDLAKGRITEKVNRETIAAAKWAVMKRIGAETP